MRKIYFFIIALLFFFGCKKEMPTENTDNDNLNLSVDSLYVGGKFSFAGDTAANNIAEWDGSKWKPLGKGITGQGTGVECMINYLGDLYVGGIFQSAGGEDAASIAKWDGKEWSPVGTGINGRVTSFAVYKGELYVGGWYSNAGGIKADNIAKWNGSSWSAVGSGFSDEIYTLCVYKDELYAGGWFRMNNTGGNFRANNIAKWNGVKWDTVGSGVNMGSWVMTLTVFNDELYAAGDFSKCGNLAVGNIAKWNGNIWMSVDSVGLPNRIYTSAVYKNKLQLAGESNNNSGPYYAVWDGNSWSFNNFSFDKSPNYLYSSDKYLYIGGLFTQINGKTVNGIFKWDGSSIQSFGKGIKGYVNSILSLK